MQSKRILKVCEELTQQSSQRELKKCARNWRNNPVKENPKSAQDTNVTIQSKSILKARKMLT